MGKIFVNFNASLFPNLDPLEKVLLVVSHFNGLGWVGLGWKLLQTETLP